MLINSIFMQHSGKTKNQKVRFVKEEARSAEAAGTGAITRDRGYMVPAARQAVPPDTCR